MKIYKTTRKVDEIEIDEKDFIDYLKHQYPEDEDIQALTDDEEEIFDTWYHLSLDEAFEEYYECQKNKIKEKTIASNDGSYYPWYEDAYQDMEWGIH